ncbi:hypothetical protein DM02DRAFT_615114 [Periconia macrospinosa]|uniref:Uncharacterized protein n=1 Tax=Periconia macrospinosa TaxID=97972 RepID=A0A2V1DMY8_9PLEO|nr:hypothetical protein DM02DRAFT_615114 [Periconia macrospinosa]
MGWLRDVVESSTPPPPQTAIHRIASPVSYESPSTPHVYSPPLATCCILHPAGDGCIHSVIHSFQTQVPLKRSPRTPPTPPTPPQYYRRAFILHHKL